MQPSLSSPRPAPCGHLARRPRTGPAYLLAVWLSVAALRGTRATDSVEYKFTDYAEDEGRIHVVTGLHEGDAPSTQQARAMLDEQAAVIRDAWQRIPGT